MFEGERKSHVLFLPHTIYRLKEVDDRNKFETLEQLCDYFEEYKKFFKTGHMRMTQLEPKLKEYRAAIEARKQQFRNEGKQVITYPNTRFENQL